MRVNITYGAEMNEVPEELEQLYTYVSSKVKNLQTQSEFIEDALAEEELETALVLLDKMRKNLASIDRRMSDIDMIAKGYVNYKEGGSNVSAGRSAVGSTGHDDDGHEQQPIEDLET